MTSTFDREPDEGIDKPAEGDIHAESKWSHHFQPMMDGIARIFDFNNALSRRTVTRSAEEDMALAWREVYGSLPSLYGQVPVSDQKPPTEDAASFAAPVHLPESEERPTSTARSAQGRLSGDEEIGYRGLTACAAAGLTYRQIDYFARTGLVEPSVRLAYGSGSQRLYSFRDILVLKMVKRLLDTGISLQQIRAAVQHLRDRGTDDLTQVTLMSDGVSVYECTSPDEVVDLLAGGQGVFGIALGQIWQEIAGELAVLPAVHAKDGSPAVGAEDPVINATGSGAKNGIERAG